MYLYGASGHAKVIIDILENSGIEVSGLFDDNPAITEIYGQEVYGQYGGQLLDTPLIISIGDNKIRSEISKNIKGKFGNAVHSSAIISPSAIIEEGSVIMQGAIIQADSYIGKHAIINTNASVDHDCVLKDYVHVSPGAILCGNVYIGEGTHIGAGAVILPGVKLGSWCRIGAGSVVINEIPDGATAVGNPSRVIKVT